VKGYSDVAEAEVIVKKSAKFEKWHEQQSPESTTEKLQTTSTVKTTSAKIVVTQKPKEIKSKPDPVKINSQDRSFK
jgi:hypothetical protein